MKIYYKISPWRRATSILRNLFLAWEDLFPFILIFDWHFKTRNSGHPYSVIIPLWRGRIRLKISFFNWDTGGQSRVDFWFELRTALWEIIGPHWLQTSFSVYHTSGYLNLELQNVWFVYDPTTYNFSFDLSVPSCIFSYFSRVVAILFLFSRIIFRVCTSAVFWMPRTESSRMSCGSE